jgi:hypothetical protein
MYFEPNYPALRFFCSYCGAETRKEKYLTVRAKDMTLSHEPKFLVFCEKHAPKHAELVERLETWKAQERAKFEQGLAEETPKMAKILEAEVFGGKIEEVPAKPVAQRKKRAGEIPNPRDLNGGMAG